ncbi:MAG: threonine synthase [Clostridiales bacterium]|jgi:threonine synthase|nr:threonine synthase [Clostridiales bacterium]
MNYISTRNKKHSVSPSRAILDGIAPDGGLYVPEKFPVFSTEELVIFREIPYAERLARVLERFLAPDFSFEELYSFALRASEKFDGDECPVVKVDEEIYLLELFHGATSAFKDMALSVMPYLMQAAKKKQKDDLKTLILVATSGDTGKAALEGYRDAEGINVMVFYPNDGVSGVQKAQMTTTEGKNVFVSAIEGNFDDAQAAVKSIFADREFGALLLKKGIELSSANSINIGRLIPQIAYYISAYVDLASSREITVGEEINFVVPTGNFGNILAGYYAKRAGLPIGKLLCASNKNNILTDFFRTGEYDTDRTFHKTVSPSMDILVSSNLERLLFEFTDRDDKAVTELMTDLKEKGKYSVGNTVLTALDREFFAGSADEKATKETIMNFYDAYGYVLDPHTAVAVSVLEEYLSGETDDTKTVIVSTASPFKFARDVYEAVSLLKAPNAFTALKRLENFTGAEIPEPLKDLDMKEPRFLGAIKKDAVKDSVLEYAEKI